MEIMDDHTPIFPHSAVKLDGSFITTAQSAEFDKAKSLASLIARMPFTFSLFRLGESSWRVCENHAHVAFGTSAEEALTAAYRAKEKEAARTLQAETDAAERGKEWKEESAVEKV